MAEITKDVDTGGTGDYASLNTWESTEQQDLTDGGGDWMHATTRASGDAADTSQCQIFGWTTAAANYILVDAAAGEEAIISAWSTSRYRLSTTDTEAFQLAEEFIRLAGMQIENVAAVSGNQDTIDITSIGAGGDIRIGNCRIRVTNKDVDGGYTLIDADDTDINLKVYVCILENGTDNGIYLNVATSSILNCVIYNMDAAGIQFIAGTNVVKNTAVFVTAEDFNDDGGTNTIDFCASDDGGGTNEVAESGGGANWPSDFNAAASGDFTLLVGSNLKGAGINNPGSGLYSVDMEGDTYVVDAWSLSVDEYTAVGGDIVILRRRRM